MDRVDGPIGLVQQVVDPPDVDRPLLGVDVDGEIGRDDLETEKLNVCSEFSSPKVPKNTEILQHAPDDPGVAGLLCRNGDREDAGTRTQAEPEDERPMTHGCTVLQGFDVRPHIYSHLSSIYVSAGSSCALRVCPPSPRRRYVGAGWRLPSSMEAGYAVSMIWRLERAVRVPRSPGSRSKSRRSRILL